MTHSCKLLKARNKTAKRARKKRKRRRDVDTKISIFRSISTDGVKTWDVAEGAPLILTNIAFCPLCGKRLPKGTT